MLSYGTATANQGVFLGSSLLGNNAALNSNTATNSGTGFGAIQGGELLSTGVVTLPNNWDIMSLTAGSSGTAYNVQSSTDGAVSATSTGLLASSVDFSSSLAKLQLGTATGGTSGSTSTSWNGDIGDVVVSGQNLTIAQRQEIQTYLSEKYDTTATKGSMLSQSVDGNGDVLTQSMDLTTTAVTDRITDQLYISDTDSRIDTVTVSGADYVRTGAGNDVVTVQDLNFRQLDGGAGTDTLKFGANITNIDLSQLVSNARNNTTMGVGEGGTGTGGWHKLYSFEQIDMTNQVMTTLSLRLTDVLELSDSKTLLIQGDTSVGIEDLVTLLGTDVWTPNAANGTNGQLFTNASGATVFAHQFTSGSGTLWVQDGLKIAYNNQAAVVL